MFLTSLNLTLVTAAIVLASPTHAHTGNTNNIEWFTCDPATIGNASISCGFFQVPLDYQDPSAGKGRIAFGILNATVPASEKLGTVFFNPGGPALSGILSIALNADLLQTLTAGLYDIVGLDTRGTGNLTIPGDVFCFDNPEEQDDFFAGTIQDTGIAYTGRFTDPEDVSVLLAQAPLMQHKYKTLGQRCLEHSSGHLLKYVGSAATARDVAGLADALDGEGSAINFVSVSYGTLVAMWLANMFPERVGRFVLDGVLDPVFVATQSLSLHWSHQLVDVDSAYTAFLTGCSLAGPAGCSIAPHVNSSASDVDSAVNALLQTAHDAERANSSVPVTSGDIRMELYGMLFNPTDWASFANDEWPQFVAAVGGETGANTSTRTEVRRGMHVRRGHGSQEDATTPLSGTAIQCGDSVDVRDPSMRAVFNNLIAAARNVSRIAGAAWPAQEYMCDFWPVRAVERYEGPFNKTLASPVLVLSNVFDPITPLAGAREIITLLGSQARLVTQRGIGVVVVAHHQLGAPFGMFIETVVGYIVNGTLPADNSVVCPVAEDFEPFAGVNTEMIFAAMSL
ncbi:alpha/beta-hydrolase [Epithele typhae]|uniref:alpha/beta-hydrolase n=1 Tax=Epithele typhae TaxID=378194 RepID=UPI002007BDCC|nr:alpha/beta-hydrolase [Epithele typhae]KAH9926335.1 alpha/beta-hydrolase [Epithele typhae]